MDLSNERDPPNRKRNLNYKCVVCGIFRTRRTALREHYILYHDMSLGYGHVVPTPMPADIAEKEKDRVRRNHYSKNSKRMKNSTNVRRRPNQTVAEALMEQREKKKQERKERRDRALRREYQQPEQYEQSEQYEHYGQYEQYEQQYEQQNEQQIIIGHASQAANRNESPDEEKLDLSKSHEWINRKYSKKPERKIRTRVYEDSTRQYNRAQSRIRQEDARYNEYLRSRRDLHVIHSTPIPDPRTVPVLRMPTGHSPVPWEEILQLETGKNRAQREIDSRATQENRDNREHERRHNRERWMRERDTFENERRLFYRNKERKTTDYREHLRNRAMIEYRGRSYTREQFQSLPENQHDVSFDDITIPEVQLEEGEIENSEKEDSQPLIVTVNVPEKPGPLHIVNLVANRAAKSAEQEKETAKVKNIEKERKEKIDKMEKHFRDTPVHQYQRLTEHRERRERFQRELNNRQTVRQIQQEEIRTFESAMDEIFSRIDNQQQEQEVAEASQSYELSVLQPPSFKKAAKTVSSTLVEVIETESEIISVELNDDDCESVEFGYSDVELSQTEERKKNVQIVTFSDLDL